MAQLGTLVDKVRSKNAGPFWLTLDIFCGSDEVFERLGKSLSTERVALLFGADRESMKRFEIASLNVIKFSLPRPQVQGAVEDRDLHGASWAALLAELDVN